MRSPEFGQGSPEKEPKEREIKYTYPASDSNLDFFYDLGNHIMCIEDEFPGCEVNIMETEDDIDDEKPMTLTIKVIATEKNYNKIKKFLYENFSPQVLESQNARIDELL